MYLYYICIDNSQFNAGNIVELTVESSLPFLFLLKEIHNINHHNSILE